MEKDNILFSMIARYQQYFSVLTSFQKSFNSQAFQAKVV